MDLYEQGGVLLCIAKALEEDGILRLYVYVEYTLFLQLLPDIQTAGLVIIVSQWCRCSWAGSMVG